jgi:hypothetical protein
MPARRPGIRLGQAQGHAFGDIRPLPPPCQGWQVMGGDTGGGLARPLRRRAPRAIRLPLKPQDAVGEDIRAIQRLAQGRTFWITVSRRTPEHARVRFRRLATTINGIFWENQERDGPNPYVAFLSQCDAAMVTCESANMIADPAFFGKPVHLLKLDGGSPRFDKLHAGLIDRRAARWFTGSVQTWTYAPVREAARAADDIVRRVLERQPNRWKN